MLISITTIVSIIVAFLSVCLTICFLIGWKRAFYNKNVSRETLKNPGFVSVLVPVRNEETNLETLFGSLAKQGYPKDLFEVIVIDDHSDDDSGLVINHFISKLELDIKRINLTEDYGKKRAITKGVRKASGDIVITIDADCVYDENWLETIMSCYHDSNRDFYILPVANKTPNSFLEMFQSLEFLTFVGVGISTYGLGYPILCNGANLCFTKSCFYTVNGYEGNYHEPSGDDVFLLQKVKRRKDLSIGIIMDKHVIAKTDPKNSFGELINQRIRWATKKGIYKDFVTNAIGAVFLILNVYLLTGFLLSFFDPSLWVPVFSVFMVKLFMDYLYLSKIARWFDQNKTLRIFLIFEILYPFYVIIIFVSAFFLKPKWKGRKIISYQIKQA